MTSKSTLSLLLSLSFVDFFLSFTPIHSFILFTHYFSFSILLILPFILIHSISLIFSHLIICFCIPSVSHTLFVSHPYPPPFVLSLFPTLFCSPFSLFQPLNHFSVLSLSSLSSRGPFLPHSFTLSSFLFFLYLFRGLPSWPLTLTGAHQEMSFSALSGVKPPSKLVDDYHLSIISGYL